MLKATFILKSFQTAGQLCLYLGVGHLHDNKQGQTITVDKYRVVRTDTM